MSARRRICICTAAEVAARRPFSACIADNCRAVIAGVAAEAHRKQATR